jgi:inner membrane protein
MLTNGGKGVALLWPLDSGRYFFAFTPVEVSPIGVSRFLSGQGLAVLWSELCWIVLPLLLVALLIRFAATPASVSRR